MKAISVRRSLASELSDLAYMSSPEKRTWPALGLSRPPRRWSRVDFPTPEAPMRATLSAWLTTRLTPPQDPHRLGPDPVLLLELPHREEGLTHSEGPRRGRVAPPVSRATGWRE